MQAAAGGAATIAALAADGAEWVRQAMASVTPTRTTKGVRRIPGDDFTPDRADPAQRPCCAPAAVPASTASHIGFRCVLRGG